MEQFVSIITSKKDEIVDVTPLLTRLTLNIIGLSAFGMNFNAQDVTSEFANKYIDALNTFVKEFLYRLNRLHLRTSLYKFTNSYKRYKDSLKILHDTTESVIRNRMAQQKDTTSETKYKDFLEILLSSKDENGKSITFEELRAEVDTFMFEGHDTTTSGLTWTVYLLGKYPEIQEKCRQEIRKVLGTAKYPTYDQLSKFIYFTAVLKESHRLYPPVPTISRLIEEPMKILDYNIPSGVIVRLAPYVIHRNPKVWKNPDEFIPERFLEETRENGDEPFAFVPFSAGARNCIGQKFALNEETTILTTLLNHSRIILDETKPVDINPTLVMRPADGIFVKFEKLQ